MYASIENLWSVLFTTGYLTQTGRKDTNTFMFTIPNMEIRNIFLTQIMEYFKKTVSENGDANYAQTECQFRYCGTAIPFLTVRSTAR